MSFPAVGLPHPVAPSLPPRSLIRAVPAAVLGLLASAAVAQTPTEPQSLPAVQVTAEAETEAGASVTLTQQDMEKTGGKNMADIIRYQPLVEAPGTVQGATRGASAYDRSGTTGYNIRGMEGNRIGLDIDGIEMPSATSRAPLTNRAQDGTFGMGRDFMDPELYSTVQIQSGTTNARRSAGGIGGAVSFGTKSPQDYVSASKPFYAGAKLGYDGADDSWHKAITAAGQSGAWQALVSYSRRDGHQGENHSAQNLSSYPEDRSSDALLLKANYLLNTAHVFSVTADLYRRNVDSVFETWNSAATEMVGLSQQDSQTRRNTVQLGHVWSPANGWLDQLDTRVHYQNSDMHDVRDSPAQDFMTGGYVTRHYDSQDKTRQIGFSSSGSKVIENHHIRFGVNASRNRNEHPFTSDDAFAGKQPFPDTTTDRLGLFVEDTIGFAVGGKRLAVVPGLRVDRVDAQIRNTGQFGNARITQEELVELYGNAPSTTIVSPSLAVLYDLQPKLTAYAQWKRGGRAPTNSEIFGYWNGGGGTYALLGKRDLKKETSNTFDLGLKGRVASGVQLNSSVFYSQYKDFISYTRFTRANNPEMFTYIQDNLNILYQADNRDKAHVYGLELAVRLEHGTWLPAVQGFYSTWALGYSKGQAKSYYAGDKDVDLDTVQPGKAIVGLGYDAPSQRWGASLTGTFVQGKQAVATNRNSFSNNPGAEITDSSVEQFRVPGFARFDLSGYWRINRHTRLNAGIYNLGDKRYWSYSSARSLQPSSAQDRRQIELSTQSPRTYAMSLSVDF